MKHRSLYLHFPFCETKCHYCDFYSIARDRTKPEDRTRFAEALRREIELRLPQISRRPETVFFGGGTPSMTDPEEMKWILEPLLNHWETLPEEWTLEANPSSIERGRLRAFRELGVNRISMGVQSLRDDVLKRMGRPHSAHEAREALSTAVDCGFEGISVDLLCGVPGQDLRDLESTLTEFIQYPITHLSCYLLTLAPNHAMFKDLPDENQQQAELLFLHDWMKQAGFEHYEVSNFARPGGQARHNLVYWTSGSYLGMGPSAHSFDAGRSRRWKNVSSIHRYADTLLVAEERLVAARVPEEQEEFLRPDQLELETWMLGLRLNQGLPLTMLATERQQRSYAALLERGFVEPHGVDRFHLTSLGMTVSDSVIAEFTRE